MKKHIFGGLTVLLLAVSNAAAAPYEVIANRAMVRKMPTAAGEGVGVVLKGRIIDGAPVKNWVLVGLSDGSKGYIFGKALKALAKDTPVMPIEPGFSVLANGGRVDELKNESVAVPQTPLAQGGIHQKVEVAVPAMRTIKIKGVGQGESDNARGLTAQIAKIGEENEKLKKEVAKAATQQKALQIALANADSRLREAVADKHRLTMELRDSNNRLADVEARLKHVHAGGRGKLLALADAGEPVQFTGVGEAQIAALDGRTALRFPISMTKKADKVFMSAKAERYLQGAYVYYILDSSSLSF